MAFQYDHDAIRTLINQSFTANTLILFCYDSPDFHPIYANVTAPQNHP